GGGGGGPRHTGSPPLFGVPAPRPAASAAAPGAARGSTPAVGAVPGGGVPTASTSAAPGATPAPSQAPAAAGGELITLSTDFVKATVDTRGGDLVHLELLQYHDQFDRGRNVVLFDRSSERTYHARTGLATVDGVAYPNHETLYTPVPGPREMAAGTNTLELQLDSPSIGGVRVRKPYTPKRGDSRIGVKHELVSSGDKPVMPQLYLQLVRDGTPPAGESSYYFTFTGPAMYTDAKKFHKIEFKDIDKGKADYPHSAND